MVNKIVITRKTTSPTNVNNQVEIFTDDSSEPVNIDNFASIPDNVRRELRELFIRLHEWTVVGV